MENNRLSRLLFVIIIILISVLSSLDATSQTPARHTNGTVYGGYATAPVSPAPKDGQMYYNNVDKSFYKFDGSTWSKVGGSEPSLQDILVGTFGTSNFTNVLYAESPNANTYTSIDLSDNADSEIIFGAKYACANFSKDFLSFLS